MRSARIGRVVEESVTAFIAMFVIVFVEAFGQPGQPGPPDPSAEFVAVVLESMVGFACSTLTTLVAIVVAWRHGVRVWVDGGIHEARLSGTWPPVHFCRANRAIRLTITALTIALSFVTFTTFYAVMVALEPLMKGHDELATVLALAAMLLGMFLLASTILVFKDWVARNLVAATPQQCWPEEYER